MKTGKKTEEPPSLSDLDGWKAVANADGLNCLRPEDIVAAIQRIGPTGDPKLLSALISHISDRIVRYVRPRVKRTYRNEGEDIVTRVHHQLIVAVLTPKSADGKALCRKFHVCMKTRLIDAVRTELRYERLAKPIIATTTSGEDAGEEKEIVEQADDTPAGQVEQTAHVEGILNKISDPRKRDAFRLHMEGCPLEPGKGSTSIAQELGISAKTAGTWIAEVQEFLKNTIGEPNDQAE